jgi:hypothetical protein
MLRSSWSLLLLPQRFLFRAIDTYSHIAKIIFPTCVIACSIAQAAAQTSGDAEAINQQRVLVQYLTDSHMFAQQLKSVITTTMQLLGSKSASDVKGAIEFFVTASEFGVPGAIDGVRKMLALMWSKDTDIKQTAMDAYKRLYLSPDPAVYTTPKARQAVMAKNLIDLTVGANLGDLTSMEEMVRIIVFEIYCDLTPSHNNL